MADFVITVERFDQLKQFPELFESRFGDAMNVSTTLVLGEAIELSPNDLGFFVNSLDADVIKQSPLQIIGRVSASAPHAPIIEGVDESGKETEWGRRPGKPGPFREGKPLRALPQIEAWVVRKGLTIEEGQTVESVAVNVARHIKHHGIKPKRPIKRAMEAKRDEIQRIFDEASEKMAKDLEGSH